MAGTTKSRPELKAHEHAMRAPFDNVVQELRNVLTRGSSPTSVA